MTKQPLYDFKCEIAQAITALDKAQALADQLPTKQLEIQTSLGFIIKSTLDLTYRIHDLLSQEKNNSRE